MPTALCGAAWGERSPERVNSRNGYRIRGFDTRVGTIDLAIPELREGTYYPDWLLEPRRRAEKALVAVVAEAYVDGVSTRRVDDLVKAMGIDGISKSQVSEMAAASTPAWRPSATGPSTPAPTPTWHRRPDPEGPRGRPHRQRRRAVATGVNADGHREIIGFDVVTTETAPAGRRSCGPWSPAACPGWSS